MGLSRAPEPELPRLVKTPRRPVDRIRALARARLGITVAARIPQGYQRMGDLVLVRWPEDLGQWDAEIGRLYAEELGVKSVLALSRVGKGPLREPQARLLSGRTSETLVRDGPLVYHLDAARLLYSAGNMEERHRTARRVREGEWVADLFAGIGYFALPAAKLGRAARVYAVEKNPTSFHYLTRNIRANRVADRVVPLLGDNRTVDLPLGAFDRVFLGYLPSALPFVQRAVSLLKEQGGWIYVHSIESVRLRRESERSMRETLVRTGATLTEIHRRRVKSYGPSREHVVWEIRAVPSGDPRSSPSSGRER